MFVSSTWNIKEPTHYARRVGHEVPDVVAVLCECLGGYKEVIHLTWDVESWLYMTLHFAKLDKNRSSGKKKETIATIIMKDLKKRFVNNFKNLHHSRFI